MRGFMRIIMCLNGAAPAFVLPANISISQIPFAQYHLQSARTACSLSSSGDISSRRVADCPTRQHDPGVASATISSIFCQSELFAHRPFLLCNLFRRFRLVFFERLQ